MYRPVTFYLLLFLFFLSGFSGLIYESIWTRYLKLFLGHAAYAQTLVLIIFMGGMALGAWYAGKKTHEYKNLFLVYAIVEALIGLLAIFFHSIFTWTLDISLNEIIPALNNIYFARTYQWSIAALLILPQSFLLGTTFPLMANAVIRHFNIDTGKSISLLYFTNSIGAALGVLISGFVLIKWLGLPGTIALAGILNIIIALFLYQISKQTCSMMSGAVFSSEKMLPPLLILFAATITGMASFIYEITWIRMLSMVLGSSTHAFELMLSAFILGLALGGFFIRKRIDGFKEPVQTIAQIQVIMGLFAIISIPLYHFSFDGMGLLLSVLNRTDNAYLLYVMASHAIAMLIMLPTTICAGMTLPLLTHILLQQNYGERSIAHIYSANTIGAIIGVVVAIFIILPVMGLKNGIIIGGLIDILLGFFILFSLYKTILNKSFLKIAISSSLVIFVIYLSNELDPKRLVSGVYRTGVVASSAIIDVPFYKDGKTASIGISEFNNGNVMITTNGKPDATIAMKTNISAAIDEVTMIMAAVIPMVLNKEIKNVANIGFGSGLTSHVLLHFPEIKKLDTIEIEPEIIEAARYFLPRVKNAYNDPRSIIHIEDAKTFFSLKQEKYDLIVSEPSNPWVSGTASLFTDEFYEEIKKHLTDEGVFAQWLQIYEIDLYLVMSILKTLNNQFPSYQLYATNNSDILFIAHNKIIDRPIESDIFKIPDVQAELNRVGINSIRDIYNRFLGDERIFRPVIEQSKIPMNSDYFPFLDLNAERARFLKSHSGALTAYRTLPFPLLNMFHPDLDVELSDQSVDDNYHTISKRTFRAEYIVKKMQDDSYPDNPEFIKDTKDIIYLKNIASSCDFRNTDRTWISTINNLMVNTVPYLTSKEIILILGQIKPECTGTLDETQQNWLKLYAALGNRDLNQIQSRSRKLLSHMEYWTGDEKYFLLISNIASNIFQKNFQKAQDIWNKNQQALRSNSDNLFALSMLHALINNY